MIFFIKGFTSSDASYKTTWGIIEGKLQPNVRVLGYCAGTQSGSYRCRGTNNYIKWDLFHEITDFEIRSEFKVDRIAHTAVTFVLWSGHIQYHLGLDGHGNTLFYEGGSWGGPKFLGKTNLDPTKNQTIVIIRTGNFLKVYLDGIAWREELTIFDYIDAIGWRPWRNTIHIKNLMMATPRAKTENLKLLI